MLEWYYVPMQKRHYGKMILFHDKDTTHTADYTWNWLKNRKINNIFFPSKSPDLNPIELLWNILEQRVMKHNPLTIGKLEHWVEKEWASLEQEVIDKTIKHVEKLMPLIIDARGNYVIPHRHFRH